MHEMLAPMDVRVLHVLIPPVIPDDELFRREAAEWNSPDGGKDALRSAQALLAGAGIPYTSEIRRGYVPQEIANYAKELNCSAIIMGTRGMGTTEQIFEIHRAPGGRVDGDPGNAGEIAMAVGDAGRQR